MTKPTKIHIWNVLKCYSKIIHHYYYIIRFFQISQHDQDSWNMNKLLFWLETSEKKKEISCKALELMAKVKLLEAQWNKDLT